MGAGANSASLYRRMRCSFKARFQSLDKTRFQSFQVSKFQKQLLTATEFEGRVLPSLPDIETMKL